MRHSKPARLILCGFVVLLLSLTAAVAAKEVAHELTPKGIYHAVDEYQRTGVKFFVELKERGKKPRRVPVTHDFETGDRFTFTYEINRDTYIYVINQTVRGRTAAAGLRGDTTSAGLTSKRIERVYMEVSPPQPPPRPAPLPTPRSPYLGQPRLLFPTYKAGINNRLKRDRPYLVPARGHYVMDDLTGTERLFVVISDRRLDLSDTFYSENGRVRGARAADRLRRQLGEWTKNAEVELVDKGIVHAVESYGVSIDPAKPAVVEIDLRHCR